MSTASVAASEAGVYALVLGRVILSLRERRGLTQTEVSSRASIAQSTLSRIERAQTQPDAYTVRLLAAALGTTAEGLSGIVDDALRRTEQAAEAAVPGAKTGMWWQAALGLAGVAGLAGLVVFAVAVAMSDETNRAHTRALWRNP